MAVPPAAPVPHCESIVTIRTAEMAAATKIYLEVRYSSILGREPHQQGGQVSTIDGKVCNGSIRGTTSSLTCPIGMLEFIPLDKMRRFRYLISHATTTHQHSAVTDYHKIRLLGKGSFGTVQLVQRKLGGHLPSTKFVNNSIEGAPKTFDIAKYLQQRLFAMKVIRKVDMLCLSQEGHLRAERDCLVAATRGK
jgi:protein-serine/threonine kinase